MSGNSVRRDLRRVVERTIEQELDGRILKIGITAGNHQCVEFIAGGREHQYFFPNSPSCSRALKNARAGLRRIVRGALP